MKVTAVYGQSHRGMTWYMTQRLIEHLVPDDVDEFFLPGDGPPSCTGCCRCFLEGEGCCPHSDSVVPIVRSILSSDVVVLASPNYVDGMSGAMKDLMDHMAYMWMSHRPQEEMFSKVGVVITSSAGAMNHHVLSAMERQVSSWMVLRVYRIGMISHAWTVDDLSDRNRRMVDRKSARIAGKIRRGADRTAFSVRQRFMFALFRSMQSGKAAWNETDRAWWEEHGWLGKERPWKR